MSDALKRLFQSALTQLGNKFVDIMALIIAIAAVVVSVRQSETQTKIEILNKQPLLLLMLIRQEAPDDKNGFLLKNIGFGPALIKSFKYYDSQQEYKRGASHQKWPHPKGYIGSVYVNFDFTTANDLEQDDVIKLEETLYLLGTRDILFPYSKAADSMRGVIIEIEYKSLNPIDTTTYYLKFCDRFIVNNIRQRKTPNTYEPK
jgi:hypothetical protein